jgi:hypothetical protein
MGASALARDLFGRVRLEEEVDVFWWPMAAVVRAELGDRAEAHTMLEHARGLAVDQGTDELKHILFRVSARLGRDEALLPLLASLSDSNAPRRASAAASLVRSLLRMRPEAADLARTLNAGLPRDDSPAHAEIAYRLGDAAGARAMLDRLLVRNWDSYYALGGIIPALLATGAIEEARRTMERSVVLRPGSIRHYEFLAGACFAAGVFADAAHWCDEVVALKPYDQVYRGLAAYARLRGHVRDGGAFGTPSDQPLIFQTYQSFYYPDGPQIR